MDTDFTEPQSSVVKTETAYIKLIKNTKGYNWEIKMFVDSKIDDLKKIEGMIKELNDSMISNYGNTP